MHYTTTTEISRKKKELDMNVGYLTDDDNDDNDLFNSTTSSAKNVATAMVLDDATTIIAGFGFGSL